jgi:phosphonate transport system permease protein
MTITPSQDRARGTPPSPEQRPILAKKGWSTFRKAPAFVASWRSLALTILAVAALAYGWKITRIDLYQLVAGLPNMRHIALGLMQPDVATQTTETTSLSLPMNIGAGAGGNVTSVDGRLRLEPASVAPGHDFTISGSGLQPNTTARLHLVDSSNQARLIYGRDDSLKIGADGSFKLAFEMPSSFALGAYTLRADVVSPTGEWRMSDTLQLSLDKMLETIFLALMGTAFGVVLSVPLSFLAARNLMKGSAVGSLIYYATRTFFNLTRSIEVMIVAVIMAVVVGIGPFAGVMALVIHSIGALGKLYSEAIESIDPGPIEAITATGASRLQVVLFAVLPQVVPQFISFTLYRWDINVRMSTIIGFVGGGGIGYLLIQYINLLQWNQAGTVIWLIAIVVGVMDYASAVLRERVV